MKITLLSAICVLAAHVTLAHLTTTPANTLPFHPIPDYPAIYTTQTMLVRMIDGLGFRYYWATETLTTSDLAYNPPPKPAPLNTRLTISWA